MEEIIESLRKRFEDPEGDFPNGLQAQEGKLNKVHFLPFKYRKKKADGSFSLKTYEAQIKILYNPFTGEKL